MSSFRVSHINFKKAFMAFAVVVAAIAPGLTAFVSADQLATRSITLSSAAAGTTGVSYDVNFTAVKAADTITIDFCDSPVIGTACNGVTGFTAVGAGVSTNTPSFTLGTHTATQVTATGTITPGAVHLELEGITNPSTASNVYARITTTNGGSAADEGSVALAFTDKIGVSAAVQESMAFCVSKTAIGADCSGVVAPSVQLGEETAGAGSPRALVAGTVSKASIYSQISTNAANGAVVNLKSNATGCGGLLIAGDPGKCYIAPASSGIDGTTALFGVKVTGTTQSASGIFQPVGGYGTDYHMGWVLGDATGVTGTYGDEVLNTNNKPANNQNATLEFGATITNSTPAGLYSADLSLIATGKF